MSCSHISSPWYGPLLKEVSSVVVVTIMSAIRLYQIKGSVVVVTIMSAIRLYQIKVFEVTILNIWISYLSVQDGCNGKEMAQYGTIMY